MCADIDLALRRFKPGEDDFSGFDCGDSDLNEFIRDDAPRLEQHDVTRVYVAANGSTGLGYVAIVADTVVLKTPERKKLGLDQPKNVPALKIGRLAVDVSLQNKGVGEQLIKVAYQQALVIRRPVGCRLLTVDAYAAKVAWYEKRGFVKNKGAPEEDKCPLCAKPLTLCPHCQQPFPDEAPHTVSMRLDLKAEPAPAWAIVTA